MNDYELRIQATGIFYDEAIRAAEQEDIEILCSVVPGSRLDEIIHNRSIAALTRVKFPVRSRHHSIPKKAFIMPSDDFRITGAVHLPLRPF